MYNIDITYIQRENIHTASIHNSRMLSHRTDGIEFSYVNVFFSNN